MRRPVIERPKATVSGDVAVVRASPEGVARGEVVRQCLKRCKSVWLSGDHSAGGHVNRFAGPREPGLSGAIGRAGGRLLRTLPYALSLVAPSYEGCTCRSRWRSGG